MGKKPAQKFDNKKIRQILETEDEFISNLLGCFEVPNSVEGKFVHIKQIPNANKLFSYYEKRKIISVILL